MLPEQSYITMFYVEAQENKETSLELEELSFWTANKQTLLS